MIDIRAKRDKRNDQRLQSLRTPYAPPVLNAQGKPYKTHIDLQMVAETARPHRIGLDYAVPRDRHE